MPPGVAPAARPAGPPPGDDLAHKEALHQIAATCAAGVMATFQLTLTSLDPTFADQTLKNAVAVYWGLYQTFYAAAENALASTDGTWKWLTTAVVPPAVPPAAAPTAAQAAASVQAMLAQLGVAAPAAAA